MLVEVSPELAEFAERYCQGMSGKEILHAYDKYIEARLERNSEIHAAVEEATKEAEGRIAEYRRQRAEAERRTAEYRRQIAEAKRRTEEAMKKRGALISILHDMGISDDKLNEILEQASVAPACEGESD